jgi:hypothetical protein
MLFLLVLCHISNPTFVNPFRFFCLAQFGRLFLHSQCRVGHAARRRDRRSLPTWFCVPDGNGFASAMPAWYLLAADRSRLALGLHCVPRRTILQCHWSVGARRAAKLFCRVCLRQWHFVSFARVSRWLCVRDRKRSACCVWPGLVPALDSASDVPDSCRRILRAARGQHGRARLPARQRVWQCDATRHRLVVPGWHVWQPH